MTTTLYLVPTTGITEEPRFRQRIQEAKELQLESLDLSSYWDAFEHKEQKLTQIPDEVSAKIGTNLRCGDKLSSNSK